MITPSIATPSNPNHLAGKYLNVALHQKYLTESC
jgi:hypothetical protein